MQFVIIIGLALIAISVTVNLIEIRKFIKAFIILNQCTVTFKDKFKYPFRFIKISRLLSPLLLDICIMGAGTFLGLGSGTLGFILGLGSSCAVSLGVKFLLYWFGSKTTATKNFDVEYAKLIKPLRPTGEDYAY